MHRGFAGCETIHGDFPFDVLKLQQRISKKKKIKKNVVRYNKNLNVYKKI